MTSLHRSYYSVFGVYLFRERLVSIVIAQQQEPSDTKEAQQLSIASTELAIPVLALRKE